MRKNLIVIFIILFYSCGSDSSTNTSAGPNYHSNDYAFITELINTNTIDLDTLNMRITTITKEDLDRIVTMDLSNLGLESLPENINDLEYLESLDLSNNLFNNFPKEVCTIFEQIGNVLPIERNNLCDPTAITHCVLNDIRVNFEKQNCTLVKETQEMDFLIKFIRDNNLDSISTTIFDSVIWSWTDTDSAQTDDGKHIERITEIRWIDYDITSIPASIDDLEYLQRLELEDNALQRLPGEIRFLSRLTDLQLQNNILDALPEFIGDISNLEELNVRGNNIQNLPETIGNLNKLKYLNVGQNKLTTLPDDLCNLLLTGLRINIECNKLDSSLVNSCFYNELGSQNEHPNCIGN